jgi:hypothetical protein
MPYILLSKQSRLKFRNIGRQQTIIAKEETDFPEPDSPTPDFIVLQIITDVLITAE